MKTFALLLLAFSGFTLSAQDLAGDWQGTLQAGSRDLRAVIKVSKADNGSLKAMFYSIDQGGPGIAASAVTAQGTAVKISLAAMGGTYEGKLSADGASIAGTWTQGPGTIPLNLARATPATAWAIPEPPPPPTPMAANANPAFEVATIKPSNPDTPGKAFRVNGRSFSTLNTSLVDMLTFAYGLHPRQVTGGPGWMETDKYDILGKPDGAGQPSADQWKTMLGKLIAERFELTFHRDKKELSVFAITIGKTGSKLTKSEGDPNGLPALFFRGPGNLPARNATLGDFGSVMQAVVFDRPVVDQTGLSGRFDFTLTWTPDETQFGGTARVPPPAEGAEAPPDIFTAFQQQLGLKIEATKAPVDVLVIDKVSKPSAN